jgi:hypothetical protein
MKNYINGLLSLVAAGLLLYTINDQRNQITQLKQQASELNESMHDSLFNLNAELGRYELTEEHLKEVNPKAAKEFEQYFEHETE